MEANNEIVATASSEQPTETSVFDAKACDELLALAKRNLLCGEVPTAVNQLQDVCKQLAAKYGETAAECADSYFQYGVALLELARMENRVLGNALKGMTELDTEEEDSFAVPTVMTEDEKEQISEQVIDAMLDPKPDSLDPLPQVESNAEQVADQGKPETTDAVTDADAKFKAEAESSTETEASASETAVDKPLAADAGEGNEDEEDEDDEAAEQEEAVEDDSAQEGEDSQNEDEDVSNLQLSWEMLELAKTIYQKQDTKEAKLKSAECLKKLGEVGLESEQYTQSIEDFNTSLEILKNCVDDVLTNRRVAETHYHIGAACVNAQRYDDAVAHFRDAVAILEAKIVELNAIVGDGQESADEKVVEARKELKELEELIPEIKLKIDDAEEEKKSVIELKKETATFNATSTGFDVGSSTSSELTVTDAKPISDVSHLVRKKRKPEDDDVDGEGLKKAKTSVEEVSLAVKNDKMDCNETTEDQNEIQKENSKPDDHPNKINSSGDDTIELGETGKLATKSSVTEDAVSAKSVAQGVGKEVTQNVTTE